MGRDIFNEIRLLRARSNLTLDDGAATASLGNLCQCVGTLIMKNLGSQSKIFGGGSSFQEVLRAHQLIKGPPCRS